MNLIPTKLDLAIISVESQGNDNAIGDKGLLHHAYGPMQIRQPVCDDVNRLYHSAYVSEQMLGNRQLSIDIFRKYVNIYLSPVNQTPENCARLWNGGPAAVHPGTTQYQATTVYWHRVQAELTK